MWVFLHKKFSISKSAPSLFTAVVGGTKETLYAFEMMQSTRKRCFTVPGFKREIESWGEAQGSPRCVTAAPQVTSCRGTMARPPPRLTGGGRRCHAAANQIRQHGQTLSKKPHLKTSLLFSVCWLSPGNARSSSCGGKERCARVVRMMDAPSPPCLPGGFAQGELVLCACRRGCCGDGIWDWAVCPGF